ncbi:aldehyde dehydrogenase [Paracoccaceae bacterium]|nr:aldehyde dehydrogenase [Paracoccaceae bacterium]
MNELLTHEEYKSLAASLDYPQNPFIDGKYRKCSGELINTLNPSSGKEITSITTASDKDINLAVEKAREAFDQGRWCRLHPSERKDILIKLCKLLTRNQKELAVMESLESGKPIRDCVQIDLPETIHTIKWHAELIDKIYDQTGPSGDNALSIITREPIGVAAAILPWNFPLLMLAWKIGPALAAGCSVIVKPAEQTSLTALRVAELAAEAGVPRGVLQVLPGTGPTVGEKLGRHTDIDMVSFTGSTETGRLFLKYSSESNLKKVVLECGGKNPAVVFNDAENLDLVAEHIINGAFWNMGENCSAISRLIVHKEIKSDLLEKILERLRDWKTGDPLDPQNHLGALIDKEHCKKVSSYLSKGAVVGGQIEGCFVTPTIYETTLDNKKAKEEIFGPILSILEVQTNEEAISLANKTEYGLSASIFSGNARNALRAAREIRAGTVTVNSYGEGDIATPFGGYKQSGFGGRDNGIHAHDQYCEIKTIWIDLTDPASQDKIE